MAYLRTNQPQRGQVLIDRIMSKGDSAEARVLMGMAKRTVQDLAWRARGSEAGGRAQSRAARACTRSTGRPCSRRATAISPSASSRPSSRATRPTSRPTSCWACWPGRTSAFDKARDHLQRALAMRPGPPRCPLPARGDPCVARRNRGRQDDARGHCQRRRRLSSKPVCRWPRCTTASNCATSATRSVPWSRNSTGRPRPVSQARRPRSPSQPRHRRRPHGDEAASLSASSFDAATTCPGRCRRGRCRPHGDC